MKENQKIKILLVGDSTKPMYVNAFIKASEGVADAELFDFGSLNSGKVGNNIYLRAERKFAFGIFVMQKNFELLEYVRKNNFQYVFLYTARLINWKTVKKMKAMGLTIASYCNDNPFSDYFPRYFWRNIRKSVKYCDITYSYRKSDIDKYRMEGAGDVRLLRSYYNEDRSFLLESNNYSLRHVPKVVFLGHFESDERAEYLDALVNRGIEIGICKTPEWEKYANCRENILIMEETFKHYNEIINRAEIAIVFLSKINRDTYTRRCFEITAAGTLMLAPYNEDLAGLFREDEEAIYYRNKDDFINKIDYYLKHSNEAKKIALKGRERVLKDGHGARDRMKQIMEELCRKG